jgi:hypothetical protein
MSAHDVSVAGELVALVHALDAALRLLEPTFVGEPLPA